MKTFVYAALAVWLGASAARADALADCNSNDPQRMIAGCTQMMSRSQNNRNNLSVIYQRRGIGKQMLHDFAGAISDYTFAITLNSKNWEAFLNRSIIYRLSNEFDKAIEDETRSISLHPTAKGYEERAFVRTLVRPMRNIDRILADAKHAIELNPKSALAYLAQARVLSYQQKPLEASEMMGKAIEVSPNNVFLHTARAEYLMEARKLDDAARDIEEAKRLGPQVAAVYGTEALLYINRDDYDKALQLLDRALELDPTRPASRASRGAIYLSRNDVPRALVDFETAAKSGGVNMSFVHYHWAVALAIKGEYAAALEHINKALEINENSRNTQYVRGLIRWALGQKDEAELDFKEAIERDPKLAGPRKTFAYFAHTRMYSWVEPLPPKPGAKKEDE